MTAKKLIVWLAYIALLIPAAPAGVFLPVFEPYTFGKTELFEIITELMALIVAAELLKNIIIPDLSRNPEDNKIIRWIPAFFRLRRQACLRGQAGMIEKTVFLLLAFLALSTIFGVNPARSFWGSGARGDGLFTILHFGIFFWILARAFSREEFLKLIKFVALVSFGTALYGLAQWIGGREILSTLGNSGFYAVYLLFAIFFSLYAASQEKHKEIKMFLILTAALESITLILTQSRGGTLGLVIAFAVASFFYLKQRATTWKLPISGFLALFLLLIISPQLQRVRASSFNNITVQSRLYVWKEGLKMSLAHPLLGRGANNFEVVAPQTNEAFDKPHNIFVEMLTSYGVLGLAIYLLLFYSAYQRAKGKPWLTGLLIGYLTALFFLFDTFSSYLMLFFLLAYLANTDKSPILFTKAKPMQILHRFSFVIFFIILFFAFHFKPIYSAYYARQFLLQSRDGILDENLKNRALKYETFNSPFIKNAITLEERRLQ